MEKIIKRAMALALTLALTAGVGGALAYTTPDFSDVAAGNWAYEPVMKMADAGVIKGTSSTTFAPGMNVSAAMWLTLVGRAAFEADAKAAAQAGDNWYNAYVRVAESQGLLTGTGITQAVIEGEITRYDMAATTYGAMKLLGGKDATVDTSAIKDYGDIPTKYAAAVGQMYATGLIKGDNAGNFNGTLTMTRAEAAAVMARLIDYKANLEEAANKPVEPETPRTGKTVTFTITGTTYRWEAASRTKVYLSGVGFTFYYKDGRELAHGISDANGKFNLEVTVDEADYSPMGGVYYIISEEYVDPATGILYQSDLGAHLAPKPYTTDWLVQMYDFQ